jgi:hypothetical protein
MPVAFEKVGGPNVLPQKLGAGPTGPIEWLRRYDGYIGGWPIGRPSVGQPASAK